MKRRPFLRLTGLAGAGFGLSLRNSHAANDPAELLYAKFVPAEKNLPADWLASLTTCGHKLDAAVRISKKDGNLDIIGMTVGGIGCGTVYLSGDGRLWVWDIFNQHHEGVVPNRDTPIPEGLGSIQSHRKIRERDGLFHGLRDDATPAAEPVLDADSMAIAALSGNCVVVDAENNQVRATLTLPQGHAQRQGG